jgi:hypothetical protein
MNPAKLFRDLDFEREPYARRPMYPSAAWFAMKEREAAAALTAQVPTSKKGLNAARAARGSATRERIERIKREINTVFDALDAQLKASAYKPRQDAPLRWCIFKSHDVAKLLPAAATNGMSAGRVATITGRWLHSKGFQKSGKGSASLWHMSADVTGRAVAVRLYRSPLNKSGTLEAALESVAQVPRSPKKTYPRKPVNHVRALPPLRTAASIVVAEGSPAEQRLAEHWRNEAKQWQSKATHLDNMVAPLDEQIKPGVGHHRHAVALPKTMASETPWDSGWSVGCGSGVAMRRRR